MPRAIGYRGRMMRTTAQGTMASLSGLWAMACSRSMDGAYQTLPLRPTPRLDGVLRVGVAAGTLRTVFSQTTVGPWRRALPLPSFLVVDPHGRIVDRHVGIEQAVAHRLKRVRAQLDRILARPAGDAPA